MFNPCLEIGNQQPNRHLKTWKQFPRFKCNINSKPKQIFYSWIQLNLTCDMNFEPVANLNGSLLLWPFQIWNFSLIFPFKVNLLDFGWRPERIWKSTSFKEHAVPIHFKHVHQLQSILEKTDKPKGMVFKSLKNELSHSNVAFLSFHSKV